ncbi:MAG TPA: UDP-N-acetylmuramoyl-L-alanine--D-glutamate ligase [Limnochordales bacterium]
MDWRNHTVAVVGLGVSNRAVVRWLSRRGARLVGFDQKTASELGPAHDELRSLGVELIVGPDYLQHLEAGEWDAVVLTPGMRKDLPVLERLKRRGVPFHSEIGLVFSLCRGRTVGVTGSSGKTTTTTLIGEMLKAGPRPVYVGGNIGRPLLEVIEEIPQDAWVVLELSSFQLEMLDKSPHVAVVTNVTPNHLDAHGTMEAYVAAKERIFRFQRPDDLAVFNLDNPATAAMSREAPGRTLLFSRRQPVPAGAWLDGDRLMVGGIPGGPSEPTVLCRTSDVQLLGEHNLENILAAAAVASACGIDPAAVRAVATTFRGVPHRLEFVAEWNGVRYYNDSIATSPARAAAGIRAMRAPIVLIAGGYDKKLPFDELAAAVVSGPVRVLILLGVTAPKIEAAVVAYARETNGPLPEIVHVDSLEAAVAEAARRARPGDVVLLSPACASYDMFPNFEVRGRRFVELVHSLGAARPVAE